MLQIRDLGAILFLEIVQVRGCSPMDEGLVVSLSRPVSVAAAELLGRHLKVLGQPVRVRLIETLERKGEASVSELAEAVGVSVYDASQHLSILRAAGVVRRRKAGRHGMYELVEPRAVLAIYEQVAVDLRVRAEAVAREGPDAAE